jgi:hypothetical protein
LFKGLRIPICAPLNALVRKQTAASNWINYYYLAPNGCIYLRNYYFELRLPF